MTHKLAAQIEKAVVNEMVSDIKRSTVPEELKAKKPKKAAFVVEKDLVSSVSPEVATPKKTTMKTTVKPVVKSEAESEATPVKARRPATPAQAAHRKAFADWRKSKTKLSFAEFKSSAPKKEEEVKEPSAKKKYRLKQ